MNDLDENLRAIIQDRMNWKGTEDDTIAAIKQAFVQAGYIHVYASQETQAAIANTMLGNKVLTGQEWYDRFVQECKNLEPNHPSIFDPVYIAALRAAGLDK